MPRFQGPHSDANLALVGALQSVAEAKGVSVAQVAITWLSQQNESIVPLVGARRRDQLAESLRATAVTLTVKDLAVIDRGVRKGAASGERYPSQLMAHLDSETH